MHIAVGDAKDVQEQLGGPKQKLPYSRTLLDLIFECLIVEPAGRPGAAELFERTERGLKAVLALRSAEAQGMRGGA